MPAGAFGGREDGAGEAPGEAGRAGAVGLESSGRGRRIGLAPGIPEPAIEDLDALGARVAGEDAAGEFKPDHAPRASRVWVWM